MTNMLDALKRIESKTTSARNEAHDSLDEDLASIRPPDDPDPPADVCEVDEDADLPLARTLPFTPSTEGREARPANPPDDPIVEAVDPAYSQLAENILGQLSRNRVAAILVTSPRDGEGKTSTVAGLAKVLALREPGGVLAVDGNFHCPGLARSVGVEANRGLGDVLSGKADWRETIQSTRENGLSILPASTALWAPEFPANTANLADLLSELRREFRFVLFDAASLQYPEVAEMTRHFDGTYLVIELNRTSQGDARQAVRIIDNCEGRLLGCVLTNAAVEESRQGLTP